jgi:hypothetical protein
VQIFYDLKDLFFVCLVAKNFTFKLSMWSVWGSNLGPTHRNLKDQIIKNKQKI